MDRRLDDLRDQLQTAQWGSPGSLHACLVALVGIVSEMSSKLDKTHGCVVTTGLLDLREKPKPKEAMRLVPPGTLIAQEEVQQAIQNVRDEIERLRKLIPTEEEITAIRQARDHFLEDHGDGYFGNGWAGERMDQFLSRQSDPLKGED